MDWDSGEADLHEAMLPRPPLHGLFALAIAALAVIGGALILTQLGNVSATPNPNRPGAPDLGAALELVTDQGTLVTRRAPLPTNTRLALVPTLDFATVTPQPPTATSTPTRGPCVQQAAQGDTVYGMAVRCGHRDMSVVGEILRINNMTSANQLQIGQSLEIPWPTQAGEPEQAEVAPTTEGISELAMEPTLLPSLMWYTVKKGDTASSIIYEKNITVKILRDLNPEINFEGCDYGHPTGGPQCTVPLFEGQRLRIPAPPPTPTIPPTPSGSETPTPTITPTVNAPVSQSPSDNMLFEVFELPTLRWVASGQLSPDEIYLITVVDKTSNATYYATTRELSYQLPPDWQPTDGKRHTFAWTVAIATLKENNTAIPSNITTETRTFTWQSR